ncbi:hypothetical protein KR018_010553, partial [Drosophila ironensis]
VKMAQKPTNESTNGTATETVDETDASGALKADGTTPTLQLRLEQPRDERRVVFHDGVIDNEHLNRKKSKCCCIYKKPLAFGESSSEDDEDCEHCFGHPEKKKKNRKHTHGDGDGDGHGDQACPSLGHPDAPSTSAQASDPNLPPAEPAFEPSKPPMPPQEHADGDRAGDC